MAPNENLRSDDGLLIRPAARYFEVHYGADLRGTRYESQSVAFKEAQAAPDEMPAEPRLLKAHIEDILDKVLLTIKDSQKREGYINEIGSLTRTGLESGQLNVASDGLISFQERFARREGGPMRAKYLRGMLFVGGVVGIIGLIFGWLFLVNLIDFSNYISAAPGQQADLIKLTQKIVGASLMVLFGICLGAILSAFLRNRRVTFENIGFFDTDGFQPALRYTFLCVVAAVFGLLLYKGWLIVGITQQLVLNSFIDDPGIAIILGVLTGYAEPNITKFISGGLDTVRDWRQAS
jgi:hypothetical protein